MKRLDPGHELVVIERNAPGQTFGWGVVFSDETLGYLEENDPPTHQEITRTFAHWDATDIHPDHPSGGQFLVAQEDGLAARIASTVTSSRATISRPRSTSAASRISPTSRAGPTQASSPWPTGPTSRSSCSTSSEGGRLRARLRLLE
jgi:hypothetical protein